MSGPAQLVAVKSIQGGIEEWSEERLLPGDVIELIQVKKKMLIASAPFAGGKSGVQRELRKIHQAGESALVRVKRGNARMDMRACVVAEESMMRKKTYFLADCVQRNYIAYLMDATEEECLTLQDQTRELMESARKNGIFQVTVKDRLMSYPWQTKMQQFLPSPNSAMVFSLILMPYQRPNSSGTGDGDLEDTTARAMAWLSASQSSGVPIIFVNIQSEPLFLQSSTSRYFGSGGTEDPLNLVNSGMYPLHELEGTEINVTRAIRLWYSPPEGELAITLRPTEHETRLGVNITCTEEGFCYVSSVDVGTAAERAGLCKVFEAACAANKLLVVSRVAGEKVTPWFVSASGSIRCFDARSISEKISAQRKVREPIEFYFMVWTGATNISTSQEKTLDNASHPNTEVRYSLSSESDRFDSSGSMGTETAGGRTAGWELTVTDKNVERSTSTRSFSFHGDEDVITTGHIPPANSEEFSFATRQ